MHRFLKTAIFSAAVAATTLATLPAANAGDQWRRHQHQDRRSDHGDLALAGILGLAAGALVVGLAAQSAPPVANPYRHPRPRPDRDYPIAYVEEPPVVYADDYASAMEPWTAEWYDYCADRYRSFNARTGTFNGYDGQKHFCIAN